MENGGVVEGYVATLSVTLARVPGPVAVVPRMRMQPVAASEVATHSVEGPRGEVRFADWLAEDVGRT